MSNVRRLDHGCIEMVSRMQRNGIAIDIPHFQALSSKLARLMEEEYANIRSIIPREALELFINETVVDEIEPEPTFGNEGEPAKEEPDASVININSPEQLADLLFTHMGLGKSAKLKSTKDGKRLSTGKKNLEMIRDEDPIIAAILRYREYAKLKTTYVDKMPRVARWHPESETWRIHCQILLTRTETGRMASKNPNLQNVSGRSDLGKEVRAGFIAAPGKVLLGRDLSQIELRVLAHEADEPNMIDIFQRDGDIHVETTLRAYNLTWDDWNELSQTDEGKKKQKKLRTPIKNTNFGICIAEGQSVLTNTRGLVPIEHVSCCDKVWDGSEFVSHDGVIFNGWREVITHDGLTATPDHTVWLRDGSKVTHAEAAARGSRLAATEVEGNPIRFIADRLQHLLQGIREWGSDKLRHDSQVSGCESYLHEMQCDQRNCSRQHSVLQNKGLHLQAEVFGPACLSASRTLHCNGATMYESKGLQLAALRRSWDPVPFHFTRPIHRLHYESFSTPNLQEDGNRPYRQQWSLRNWECPSSYQSSQSQEHASQCLDRIQRSADSDIRLMEGPQRGLSGIQPEQRVHYETGTERILSGEYTVEEATRPIRKKVAVYDILNAGPNHRFTVSGKLVSNCYGLSGLGLQQQLASQSGIYWTEQESDAFIEKWFSLYPGVRNYMDSIYAMAYRHGLVYDMFGRIRMVPGVRSIHNNVQSAALREAGNHPIQSTAAGILKVAISHIESITGPIFRDAGIYVEPLLPVHDELIWEVDEDYVDCISDYFGHIMNNAVPLKVPLKSEASWGKRWEK